MQWQVFARTNAQGMCLETATGHAEIENAYYTDHRIRAVAQRLTGPVHRKTFAADELEAAKDWAEAQLS